MRTHSAATTLDLTDSFVERRGGWILSICLHVILFCGLMLAPPQTVMPPAADPEPIRVSLAEPEPAPPAVMVSEAVPAQPAAATESVTEPADALDTAGAAATVAAPAEPLPASAPEPTASPDDASGADATLAAPDGQGGQIVEETLDEGTLQRFRAQAEHLRQANAVQGRQGSSTVAGMLGTARADLKATIHLRGVKDLFTSRGATEGVVREIDTGGVPDQEAKQVLERYGIKILFARLDGPSDAPPFLNRAKTNEGQFVSKVGRGIMRTFSFGPAAIGRMVQLEEEAIRAQGLDPNKSRVKRVLFGVIPTTDGYDLGVKKIDVEPVKFDAKKKEVRSQESVVSSQ